jgi:hypothetical protein
MGNFDAAVSLCLSLRCLAAPCFWAVPALVEVSAGLPVVNCSRRDCSHVVPCFQVASCCFTVDLAVFTGSFPAAAHLLAQLLKSECLGSCGPSMQNCVCQQDAIVSTSKMARCISPLRSVNRNGAPEQLAACRNASERSGGTSWGTKVRGGGGRALRT